MSPEQARGESVDSRSDIFSFGIMLYKMYAGEYPFKGKDRVSTIAKILEARHTPIRQKNDSLPSELERIIDKCLQKDPNDRYQDTRDLVVDLRSLRRQYESGVTDSLSSISDISYTKRVNIKFTTVGSIFVSALAIILLAWYFFGSGASQKPLTMEAWENALAILAFENKTGDESLDWLQSGLPEIFLTDLAQNKSVDIISRNRILDCFDPDDIPESGLPSHKKCVKAAKSLGASMVLSGSFYKLGEKIRIDARLEDIETGKIILGEKVMGEEPFGLVDSLTAKIALSLNMYEISGSDRQVADLTSSSPEAYKEYILGMEKFASNLFEDAIGHFTRATEIDSNFALAYMRMGMTYGFQNRTQQAAPYFTKAKQLELKLPVRDRSILDIYIDLWQTINFDDAYIKIKSFVNSYPDDKEARALYGILTYVFTQDTKAALGQLDTALMIDPKYHLAYSGYNQIYAGEKQYEKAIDAANQMKEFYPDSPEPYNWLISYYFLLSRFDDALNVGQEFINKFPDNVAALNNMSSISIAMKDYDSAREYINKVGRIHADDPYLMIGHYKSLANLDFWNGKFKQGMNNLFKALEQAFLSNDSTRISNQYSFISDHYDYFEMPDSAMYFAKESHNWANRFQFFEYPITLIKHAPEREEEARELFDQALTNFKSRIPSELWGLAGLIEDEFNALAISDTAAYIEAAKKLTKDFGQTSTGNRETLGRFLVNYGRYQEGRDELLNIISGENKTTRGMFHVRSLYYIGVANEALGNIEDAKANYQELLKFWGEPEIELKEIIDSRKRLGQLTG